jgi:hypothetical protein
MGVEPEDRVELRREVEVKLLRGHPILRPDRPQQRKQRVLVVPLETEPDGGVNDSSSAEEERQAPLRPKVVTRRSQHSRQ